jgi:hypothetical protein
LHRPVNSAAQAFLQNVFVVHGFSLKPCTCQEKTERLFTAGHLSRTLDQPPRDCDAEN